MPTSRNEKQAAAVAAAGAFEPTLDEFPQDAGVVLAFRGLMCFCHNTAEVEAGPFGEIGIHNRAEHHTFRMIVMKVKPSFDPPRSPRYKIIEEYPPYLAKDTGALVTFRVNGPRNPAGPHYFKYPSTFGKHKNNFSRVPDLEGPDFYRDFLEQMPGGRRFLKKVTEAFGPVVRVTDGLFYTWVKASFDVKRRAKDNPTTQVKHLGKVAEVVAANIYLNEGGSVDLITGNGTERLQPTDDYKYLVRIENVCPPGVCTGLDFDLYDRTFEKPAAAPRLELVPEDDNDARVREKSEGDTVRDEFFVDQEQLLNPEDIKSGDDSPCGAASYGSSQCLTCT